MRSNKLASNTISSLVFQIATIVCGFILPRLILERFGSEVNGLINSITQFLSIISFLDFGVGAVFQSSLYKPLAESDTEGLSKIFVSGQKFFVRLAEILLCYVVFLIFAYPLIFNRDFGFIFTSTLIAVMSISLFAQYYFGMANSLLLSADQRGYISYNAQILTVVLNTLICYILIKAGTSIHIVKLTTSCIYLVRPLFLKKYVARHYQINTKIKNEGEPLTQKWNGLAQHFSSVLLESSDTIILTIFSTLSYVSIYSMYYLVIAGLKQLFTSATNGVQALIGDLYARQDSKGLLSVFSWTEWAIHTCVTFVFGCTTILIVPFILIYTRELTDANYDQPLFAVLIVSAYAMYCYRLPYHIVIKAAGHYKQTQRCYLISAILNIVLSVILVKRLGLAGVAIGTLIAMVYQTVWMAWYNSNNITNWPFLRFVKQISIDILIYICGICFTSRIIITSYNYLAWVLMGIKVSAIWFIIIILVNIVFFKDMLITFVEKVRLKLRKH